MKWEFELIQPPYGGVSEGPVWNGSVLLYTQIHACRIMAYDPQTNALEVHRSDTNYANGLTMDDQGLIYACEGGARRVVRYEADGSVNVLAERYDGKRFNIPNDLVVDGKGRVWFTDPFYEGAAGPFSFDRSTKELDHDSVYRLTPQENKPWTLERMTFDTTRPNGLLFSLDGQTLYVAQSGRGSEEKRELRGYPLGDDDRLGDCQVLHDFGEHRGVDGMRLDSEGNIVATAGWEFGGPGPSIYLFSPKGEVLQRHPVPANRPTNCAFGDVDLGTLYVTSTDGHLFRARTDRQGLPVGKRGDG
ncbi:MAG: SMP-30/gluconolactonase/LRE family protein [Pirellulaceae bacterium]|nr:SMP-30/gluconolactonase/LRE family protein [Pirellulaceae bacterium]